MSDIRGNERLLIEVKRLEAENAKLHKDRAALGLEIARLREMLGDAVHAYGDQMSPDDRRRYRNALKGTT